MVEGFAGGYTGFVRVSEDFDKGFIKMCIAAL